MVVHFVKLMSHLFDDALEIASDTLDVTQRETNVHCMRTISSMTFLTYFAFHRFEGRSNLLSPSKRNSDASCELASRFRKKRRA